MNASSKDVARLPVGHEGGLIEFFSPLHGAYDSSFSPGLAGASELYETAKSLTWNAQVDIDWDVPAPDAPVRATEIGIESFPAFAGLSPQAKRAFLWDYLGWHVSQFLHGEQGALLVASQLVTCARDSDSKLYAASQAFDEARHVEVFRQYIAVRKLQLRPVNRSLGRLLNKILTDPRWDLKLIGMQLIIESIALSSLHNLSKRCMDPLLVRSIRYVLRDESRHVNFGEAYLKDHLASLRPSELEERAKFCYEACVVMRNRFTPREVYEEYGMNPDEALGYLAGTNYVSEYQDYLYRRIIPVFSRIGLITPNTEPLYARIGVLDYRNASAEPDVW